MTTPTVTIASTPNPVCPSDPATVLLTVTLGTGGGFTIEEGDNLEIALTLPAGITAPSGEQIEFAAGPTGAAQNLTLNLASSLAVGTYAISWTWNNTTRKSGAQAGTPFNVVAGYSTTATLVYTVTPQGSVPLATLETALAAVTIRHQDISQMAGVDENSDTTATSGGNAVRTVVYNLPYPVRQQFNGGSALPACTATRQFYVVTTTGANATVGELLYDNGSGVGTVAVVPAKIGLEIVIPTGGFSGGTVAFTGGHEYVWSSSEGNHWADLGAVSYVTHAFQGSFPSRGMSQQSAFANLWKPVLEAQLGSVVVASTPVIA